MPILVLLKFVQSKKDIVFYGNLVDSIIHHLKGKDDLAIMCDSQLRYPFGYPLPSSDILLQGYHDEGASLVKCCILAREHLLGHNGPMDKILIIISDSPEHDKLSFSDLYLHNTVVHIFLLTSHPLLTKTEIDNYNVLAVTHKGSFNLIHEWGNLKCIDNIVATFAQSFYNSFSTNLIIGHLHIECILSPATTGEKPKFDRPKELSIISFRSMETFYKASASQHYVLNVKAEFKDTQEISRPVLLFLALKQSLRQTNGVALVKYDINNESQHGCILCYQDNLILSLING